MMLTHFKLIKSLNSYKMKSLKVLCIVFNFLCIGFISFGINAEDTEIQKGFILTAPSIFKTNVDENVCISFQAIYGDGEIRVYLKGSTSNSTLAATDQNITKGANACFPLHVNVATDLEAILYVDGQFTDENYRFNSSEKVTIKIQPELTIIQSDKPLYKPGQKVLFRVLRVDSYFLPSRSKINSIWIENPAKVRVAQWISPSDANGITDLNFQLSVEPQLGVWNIIVENEFKVKVNKTFKVEEYVLPKFSVEISSSSVILSNFENFTWKVCAHYTYGEPVAGKLKAIASVENAPRHYSSRRWMPRYDRPYSPTKIIFTLESDFFKCKSINISREDIDFNSMQFINDKQITFYAGVTEHGTEVTMSNSKKVSVKKTALNLSLISRDHFKSGLPYKGKIQAKHHDENPAEKENLKIEIQTYSEDNTNLETMTFLVKTDHLGMAFFDLFHLEQTTGKITLKVTATDYKTQTVGHLYGSDFIQPSLYSTIKPWYSPSNSFLQIDQQQQSLECNKINTITVNFTNLNQPETIVYYQLISRGNILNQNQFNSNNFTQTFEIPIMVEPRMAPKLQILVYYIRNDGEIVSDSETINVNHCYSNEVKMDFKDKKILPGSLSSLSITADIGSLCAVSVIDKSIELLSDHAFNGHKVFSMIDDKLPQINTGIRYKCQEKSDLGHYTFNNAAKSSKEAFDGIGMLVITDLELKFPPCKLNKFKEYRNYYDSPIPELQQFALTTDSARGHSSRGQASGRHAARGGFQQEIPKGTSPETSLPAVEIRDFFPETWIWELQAIENKSHIIIEREIPHSITEWSGNMFCMSSKSGLGVASRTSITSFQPFFLSYTMPYSVKNGETIPITVSIFNYLSGCFPVVVKLEESKFFMTDVNSTEVKLCLCDSRSYSLKFLIQPLKIGNLNITVRAYSIKEFDSLLCEIENTLQNVIAFDAITKSLLVKASGFPQETTQSNWICTSDFEEDSKTFEYSLELPEVVIEDSARAFISISGDLLGPTISGLDHLVKMPTGCGEQNMILFVPNIYVLQYLELTQQLTLNIKLKAISYMKLGYQRELNYKRDDGSYSAFGKSDGEGSIWLTSFVVKSFAQAQSIIYIDKHEINAGIEFIVKNQLEDGCFKSVGSVIHKELQGGTGHEQSLTLFITISLLEAGLLSSDKVIKRAFNCSKNHSTMNVYELSMKAYAAALANKTDLAKSTIKILKEKAIQKDNLMYWSTSDSGLEALDIETTSYVLLALATIGPGENMNMAIDIVRWLTKQRNSYGGFKSTQDTVLALQALVKFISLTPKISTNVSLILEANDFTDEIFVIEENRLLMQTRYIPVLPNMLDVQISGKGCSLIQVTVKYNTPSIQLSPAFTLNISASSNPISNENEINKRQAIKICTKYDGTDNKSNMAVVEIQMITGFEAFHSHLENLKALSEIGLKRFEVENDGTVELYFDQLESESKCFDMVVEEKLKVQNRKPAIIKVYDYYKPDESVSKEYFF